MENKELEKNKLEELKATLEAAKKLEEKVEEIRKNENQTGKKITEDDLKVYINGTYGEPQMTTEFYDDSDLNQKLK